MNRLVIATITAGTLSLLFSACSGDSEPGATGGASNGTGGAAPTGGAGNGTGGLGGFGGLGGLGGLGGFGGAACGCDDAWTLDCYCAEFSCRTYEEATTDPFCQSGNPNQPQTLTGCGQIVVQLATGLLTQTYVYDADDHTLLGAGHLDDYSHGSCDENGYFGGEEPADCESAITESLCL